MLRNGRIAKSLLAIILQLTSMQVVAAAELSLHFLSLPNSQPLFSVMESATAVMSQSNVEISQNDSVLQSLSLETVKGEALALIQSRLSNTRLPSHEYDWLFDGLNGSLVIIVTIIILYSIRHYLFTLNRLFGRQRFPYLDIDTADWPKVTVLVAAHNEEAVIAGALEALLEVDYPTDKITIMPVNDRSTDKTREIIDSFVEKFPTRIVPFHRVSGKPGKAAALKDATEIIDKACEIIIVFDADYIPSRGLIKQLVAPFFDPEVGATMGRVVPLNVGSNLLTRLLDLERSGGYQVDQQARMNMRLVPQYGGTVGGIRLAALRSVGGWDDSVLAEDTDLTYRLLLQNWKTVYQNRSECYEEVPENWGVRVRQIKRWAKGHNQALARHIVAMFTKSDLRWPERIDGVILLGIYAMAPLLIFGWLVALILFYYAPSSVVTLFVGSFALISFSALGNFGAFFQIAAATHLDQTRQRSRLLPLLFASFVVSVFAISMATWDQLIDGIFKRDIKWDKTTRYRQVK